jgi:alanyl-tRNA synthetase
MLSAKQIRSGFIDFFKERGHTFIPSAPIVPHGDETLLFTNAGMNQFKDIFVGLTAPQWPRAVNSQKCLRVSGKHNDLEEVGKDTYHHTFFEMLGNWSFDDYFKAEAIEWAWELLTKVWGINPDQLWATVFAGDETDGLPPDEEAASLWTKVTPIAPERVQAFGRKDNFWEMGDTGPCGPCSELHIDLGPEACDMKGVAGHMCHVNGDCARYIELWNLVFIQYNRQSTGKLVPLSARGVDTGAGLERIVAVLQNKRSNYDTDLFMPIIDRTSELTGHRYTAQLGDRTDNAFRVIADHIRTLAFAITDGATPSNDGRGYVIRRILRRASRFGRELDLHEPFLHKLVGVVVDVLGEAFPEIAERAEHVVTVVESEESSFGRTLDRGLDIFTAAAERAAKTSEKTIAGDEAFQLYDTYGFPLDLTQLMAQERGLAVDKARFDELMDEQRERARAAQKSDSLMAGLTDTELPNTEDARKYSDDACDAVVFGWIDANGLNTEGPLPVDAEIGLILDRTCFYAEAGGQVGDCGRVTSGGSEFVVEATTKIANCVVHRGKVARGRFTCGQTVRAGVSKDRNAVKKNHTATHVLQWALQQVLGKSVSQQGSYVGPDYLRFDFTYPKAPSAEELRRVEILVREKIASDSPVTWAVMQKEDAQKLGAMALFGEKYGSEVRVVGLGVDGIDQIGEAFSREFCGGTHVDRLGDIGGFKIVKEESISAGVRRITGLTGPALNDYFEKASAVVDELTVLLKASADQLPQRVQQLLDENKKLGKDLKAALRSGGPDTMAEARGLLETCTKSGESSIVVGRLASTNIDRAREAIDMLKKKAGSAAIVLGYEDDGKVTLLAGVTDDLVKSGLKAGDIIKQIAPIVGGGGGGRPQMAQAGGKDPAKIDEALQQGREWILNQLNQEAST